MYIRTQDKVGLIDIKGQVIIHNKGNLEVKSLVIGAYGTTLNASVVLDDIQMALEMGDRVYVMPSYKDVF